MPPIPMALLSVACVLGMRCVEVADRPAPRHEVIDSGAAEDTPSPGADDAPLAGEVTCVEGGERCVGDAIERCVEGAWKRSVTCSSAAGYRCEAGRCVCMLGGCGGRECGPDGCGGQCGKCPPGQSCLGGMCGECAPACDGLECGPDGCGGDCGACPDGAPCEAGQCPCVPQCAERECGADGCGGECGACDSGAACYQGGCVPRTTCQGILTCYAECRDSGVGPQGCQDECFPLGTASAQSQYVLYTNCTVEHACEDYFCLAAHCAAQYALCIYETTGDATCEQMLACVAACPDGDGACLEGCEGSGMQNAQLAYAGLSLCIFGACSPSGGAEPSSTCGTDAIAEGGPCRPYAEDCGLVP